MLVDAEKFVLALGGNAKWPITGRMETVERAEEAAVLGAALADSGFTWRGETAGNNQFGEPLVRLEALQNGTFESAGDWAYGTPLVTMLGEAMRHIAAGKKVIYLEAEYHKSLNDAEKAKLRIFGYKSADTPVRDPSGRVSMAIKWSKVA